jgi:FkbM family methyltransferase
LSQAVEGGISTAVGDQSNESNFYKLERAILRAFCKAGFAPKVIYDIGSSHSGWSYAISKIFPSAEYHLFEPLLDIKPFYRENTARVLLARPGFVLHKVALGSSDGQVKMISDRSGYGASTLTGWSYGDFNEVHKVPIRRLDTLRRELNLPLPELVKMDVQGGELNVLIGAEQTFRKVKYFQLEVWLKRFYRRRTPLLHEVNGYLRKKHFRLVELGDHYYSKLHELYSLDAYFVRSDLLRRVRGRLGTGSFES